MMLSSGHPKLNMAHRFCFAVLLLLAPRITLGKGSFAAPKTRGILAATMLRDRTHQVLPRARLLVANVLQHGLLAPRGNSDLDPLRAEVALIHEHVTAAELERILRSVQTRKQQGSLGACRTIQWAALSCFLF